MNEHFNEALSTLRKIEELQSEIEEEKKKLVGLTSDAISLSDDPAGVANYLYWETDIETKHIAYPFGLSPLKLINQVVEPKIVYKCNTCGYNITATSRNRKKETLGKLKSKSEFDNPCPRCFAKIRSKFLVEHGVLTSFELRSLPYHKYLKTRHWQDLRKRRLRIAKYKCETCGTSGKLHMHHKTYERKGCELISDVIALCERCHETFHDKSDVLHWYE